MGCCNERGVLRPLLSGSAASRTGNSTSRYQNNGDNSARYSRNHKRRGRKTGTKSANDISQQHITNSDHNDYDEFDDDDEDVILGYSGAASSWCYIFSEMLRKIGLLVWKNLLFRKRHYIVTALEIILPTLCAMILAAIKTEAGGASQIDITGNHTTIFPAIKEADLKELLSLKISCADCIVAYAPNNDQTQEIIQELASNLVGTKIDWKQFENEEEIEKLLASLSFNNTAKGSLRAAIVFENGLQAGSSAVSYKIRIVDEFHDTGLLFPWFQLPGPNSEHAQHYAETGFTGFQVMIDKILAKRFTGKAIAHTISLQAFPYPPYTISFDFNMLYFILLPQLFVLGFIFMVPSIIRAVVSEKETGIRELLKLNGLRGWMQWMGWMLNSLLVLIISITIVIFLLFWTFNIESGAVLVYSDPTVWWIVLLLFAMSASSFCFFISSFFIKPTLATTVGIILWLSSYYFLFVPLEKNYQSSSLMDKLTVALVPNMALHLAIKVMSAFEGKAVGAQWVNIAEPISSVDPLSLGHIILMFLLNTCLYMFLTVYVENVLPSEYGVRKPWYYIFQPSTYWRRGGAIQSRPTSSEQVDIDNNMPGFEMQPSNVTVGVEIRNLRKVFGRNKIAVASVSAKMYDGEIFALLGHNGAGKTTTISMLTGLFAPTGGTATVNGYDITTELEAVRDNLGLCPQHNMLFDKLTVSEHLRFFGQLKGLTSSEATKEMKELLKKLQLTEKESTLSRALSGGQKRKLSLGIALIGGTKVFIVKYCFLCELCIMVTGGNDIENM
ncbi:unnamed protein product [Orchesella dallaii]|uniref:ATP-binding cassette sub-family A member 3 n=1 Tax=Orchesella dallaii TaxID=48710 RepID=A0ABP1PZD8_9HEXA